MKYTNKAMGKMPAACLSTFFKYSLSVLLVSEFAIPIRLPNTAGVPEVKNVWLLVTQYTYKLLRTKP